MPYQSHYSGEIKLGTFLPVFGFSFSLRRYVDIHLWASRAEQWKTTINGNLWPIMNNSSSNSIMKIPPLSRNSEWVPIAVLHYIVRGETSSNLSDDLLALRMETPCWLFVGSCS